MRKLLIGGLVATQIVTPAAAADLISDRTIVVQQAEAFAGARMRLSLGGGERQRVRAGIVMAPALRTQTADNRATLRFGEGLELGLSAGRTPALSIAGRPLTGEEARRTTGPRAGISTWGWVAIGTGVVLVAGTLLFIEAMENSSE